MLYQLDIPTHAINQTTSRSCYHSEFFGQRIRTKRFILSTTSNIVHIPETVPDLYFFFQIFCVFFPLKPQQGYIVIMTQVAYSGRQHTCPDGRGAAGGTNTANVRSNTHQKPSPDHQHKICYGDLSLTLTNPRYTKTSIIRPN